MIYLFISILCLLQSSGVLCMQRDTWVLSSYPFDNQTIWLTNYNREIPLAPEITAFELVKVRVSLLLDDRHIILKDKEVVLHPNKPWSTTMDVPEVGSRVLSWQIEEIREDHQVGRKTEVKNPFQVAESLYPDVLPLGMKRRNELGYFLNAHGLLGKGAEVGVKAGEFSEVILERWKGDLLYLVDPWSHQGNEYVDLYGNAEQAQQDYFMRVTMMRLERFGDRFELIREYSVNAADDFEDGSLDFVYLDAMHEYKYVKDDLWSWWPKLKVGGLFCGHDYKDGLMAHGNFGALAAVDEFAAETGHQPLWTMGAHYGWNPADPVDPSPSWYFFKKANTPASKKMANQK